jgi:hypothetical protein
LSRFFRSCHFVFPINDELVQIIDQHSIVANFSSLLSFLFLMLNHACLAEVFDRCIIHSQAC